MQINLWVVVSFLILNVPAYAVSDEGMSPLLMPIPEGSKFQLKSLTLMHDFGDRKLPREKRQSSYFFELYVGNVDVELTLSPSAISSIRSLPQERLSSESVLKQGRLMNEILAAAVVDLESSVFVKTTASAKVVSIPVKAVPAISIDWGEDYKEKKSASINLRFPAKLLENGQKGKDGDWGMATIGKDSPFKDGALNPVSWESGDVPAPVKIAAFQILDKQLREPGWASGNAKIMIHEFGKNSIALASTKATESREANAYILGVGNSKWYQLEQSIKDRSHYHSHPKHILSGDVLKDYDQIIVIGRKSGWECGKVILIKGEKVTVQELQCEPSSC